MARKKALLIGINTYAEPSFALRGCLNDTKSLSSVLTDRYGFSSDKITVLTDGQATKQNILSQIKVLVDDMAAGDICVLAYSGHGTKHSIPADSKVVEAIVPYETRSTASLITNRDINDIVRGAISSKQLSGKANFTAIYDCCHSGKMSRDIRVNAFGEFEIAMVNRVIDLSQLVPPMATKDLEFNDDFQIYSACRDEQTAADMAPDPGKNISESRGAFSFLFHDMLRANPDIGSKDLEQKLVAAIATLVAPAVQVPVFSVREAAQNKPLFTI